MLNYLLFLPQFALIALYDWIFFVNDYASYSANSWFAFAFLHVAFVVEFVSIVILRHMKRMLFTKKHPMWLFTVLMGIQYLFTVVFSLVNIIKLKWVILLSVAVVIVELISLGLLVLVQKHREKKEGTYNPKVEKDNDVEEEVPELPELPEPPKKIKSSAMLLLMKFLSDPGSWNVPEDFVEIHELTELAASSSQYTYEDLSDIESQLKDMTNALKTYIQNKSMDRATNMVANIMDLLKEREKKIWEIEVS